MSSHITFVSDILETQILHTLPCPEPFLSSLTSSPEPFKMEKPVLVESSEKRWKLSRAGLTYINLLDFFVVVVLFSDLQCLYKYFIVSCIKPERNVCGFVSFCNFFL